MSFTGVHPAMTEAQFQQAIINYARVRGWRCHHCRPAYQKSGKFSTPISGDAGFPDLVLARNGRVVFAELKSAAGRVSDAQQAWIDAIAFDGSVECYLWRPDSWDEIERVLA